MSKRGRQHSTRRTGPARSTVACLVCFLIVVGTAAWWQWNPRAEEGAGASYRRRPRGSISFHKDIAPLLWRQCATCHRPGEAGPFPLLVYADAQKRARQIAEVTARRVMPPWLPEEGHEPLADTRRLSADEIGLLGQWAAEGTLEGSAADRAPLPIWPEGWQLGEPDVVVTLPESYMLPAEGRDVYRNFVVPSPIDRPRHVRAVEFRAGTRVIHHAFIRFDATRDSRREDAREPGPGFGGMSPPNSAESPSGHFVGWQPGRGPMRFPEGLPWTWQPGTDLVLQMHMQPRGQPEPVRPRIGFYFTERGPTNTPLKIGLSSYAIDIPAGATEFTVRDSFKLPVETELLAVLPHTHYLGKRLEATATLPDGRTRMLFAIPEWDFNWQSDYRFAQPVWLPRGTTLEMRFTYDNSAANPRNPHQPPQRVRYGVQSVDEMGELWVQLLTRSTEDLRTLQAAWRERVMHDVVAFSRYMLAQDPANARAHIELGKVSMLGGKLEEAGQHFVQALAAKPDADEAHYGLGLVAMQRQDHAAAERAFATALRCNPEHFRAHNNAGLTCLHLGKVAQAEAHFRAVLRLNPGDENALANLKLVEEAQLKAGTAPP